MRGLSTALRIPGFGRLLASYAVNELGDAIGIVALSLLVFGQTDSPLATTALFIALKVVPSLLAPLLTARLDQSPLRVTLPVLYAVEAVVFLALALQVEHFALVSVLALAVVDGVIALTGRGLSRGATATLLAEADALRDGNALLNLAFGVAGVIGLAAGGVVASAASLQAALVADAVSFAAIAVLLAWSRGLPSGSDRPEPFGERLRAGFAHVRSSPQIGRLLTWQGLALVLFTLILPIEVVYAKETLGVGDAGFGVLLATWAVGILLGGIVYVRLRRRAALGVLLLSSAAIGTGYLGMGLVRDLAAACAFSLLGGVGNGCQWIASVTMLQESTPTDLQARVTGLLESVAAAAPGLGFVLGGALTELFSPPTAYLVAGGGVLGLVVAGGPLLRPRPRPEAPSGGA